jgi:hypothetical protein
MTGNWIDAEQIVNQTRIVRNPAHHLPNSPTRQVMAWFPTDRFPSLRQTRKPSPTMPSLKEKLLDWMHGRITPSFDETALEVFAYQFERNLPYRRYAESLGKTPTTVGKWQDIPSIPTDAFKFPEHPLRCFSAESVKATFRTSGTTKDIRGEHHFEDATLYETSVSKGWECTNLPLIKNPWFLSQSPDLAIDSSLVHMFETLRSANTPNARDRWLINEQGEIDIQSLEAAASAGQPIELFTTALGLLRLLERTDALPLPPGSWVFETGGYKGVRVDLDPSEFKERAAKSLNIAPDRLLNEYGMTELSSPFYAWNGEASHRGSPWTRIRVINPDNGTPADDGQPGYLEIIDLANLGSVAAIRTQDLAIATGENSFTLLGRDPGALPRGCSRRTDDLIPSP